MLLTYLLCLPSWQPLMPSNVGVLLPEREGGWEACVAMCCHSFLHGTMIAAIVLAVSPLLTSIWWDWINQSGMKFLYPRALMCIHLA